MKTMRSGTGITITVVSILLWCAFADAAALTDLQMLGRYRELEKAAEQKLEASKQEPGASLLGYLCVAYSKLKRYNKLFDCLDKLEKRLRSGDYILETDKLFVANGGGVVGLTRGFLYAGSSTVVSSLWKVDDMATSYLMTEFYNALKATNKQEALRRAQLKAKEKYIHPFFGAAFELTGSAR